MPLYNTISLPQKGKLLEAIRYLEQNAFGDNRKRLCEWMELHDTTLYLWKKRSILPSKARVKHIAEATGIPIEWWLARATISDAEAVKRAQKPQDKPKVRTARERGTLGRVEKMLEAICKHLKIQV